jgi:hypothetical protein
MDELSILATLARTPRLDANTLRAACASAGSLGQLLELRQGALIALGLAPESAAWIAAPDAQLIAADRRWLEASTVALPRTYSTAGASAVAASSGG